jgi:hypothetical protein
MSRGWSEVEYKQCKRMTLTGHATFCDNGMTLRALFGGFCCGLGLLYSIFIPPPV